MERLVRKHYNFLMWVLVPSLLLMASVFGVNLVSRPAASLYGSAFCGDDGDCNSNRTNVCVVEFCNTNGTTNFCDILDYDSSAAPECSICNTCGNGRCEKAVSENTSNCAADCLTNNFEVGGFDTLTNEDVCLNASLEPVGCGAELENPDNSLTPPARDGCCPAGCQGTNPSDSTFDLDCCVQCGDGLIDSLAGEQCDVQASPNGCAAGQFCNGQCQCQSDCGNGILDAGEECDTLLTAQPNFGCPVVGHTCNNVCQCSSICGDGTIDPGEQCEPPNSANCDANCQIIQICGNGVVEAGEECEGTTCTATINGEAIPGVCQACICIPECQAEGSGCGDDGTGNTGVCFTGTGGTGGSSLIPVGVHTGVLVQWLAALALPGAAFAGVKARRRLKK